MPGTVLVLTQVMDVTADMVVDALAARAVPVVRIDTADFPQRIGLDARLDDGVWQGQLTTPDRSVDLDAISGVYYRRPSVYLFSEAMSAVERDWADSEARHGFGGVLSTLPARWVNAPHRNARASLKPVQLATAATHGLMVAPTMVTNVPQAAAGFARTQEHGTVYKVLCDGPLLAGHAVYTNDVTPGQVDQPGTAATAHQFQAKVKKAFEVRLTVVGHQLFAARIDSASAAGHEDWRTDYASLTYTRLEVPSQVRAGVRGLMADLGLVFGALDFAVTPEGEWVFFEVNPNGQWGWIEDALGYPIAATIAAELSKGVGA